MSSTHIVRSLHEDMEAIGLDAIDPYIAGLPVTEGKRGGQEAEREKYGMDDEELDDAEEEVEPYADEVQEAAMAIFQIARPQIDESLIDYDEAEFNYDLLDSIAAMIESAMDEGTDLEEAAQSAADTLSEAYDALTLTEEELTEKQKRAATFTGPRGKKLQKVGRNVRVGAGGRQVKMRTGADVMKSKKGAVKRVGAKLTQARKKGAIYRRSGKGKLTMRKAAVKRKQFENDSLAAELRSLLSESVEETVAVPVAHAEFAEAAGRASVVGYMLSQFFYEWGSDEDADLGEVMEELGGMAEAMMDSVSDADFDLEEAMTKLQTFSKVLGKALEVYSEYTLVDGEGNIVEMDDGMEDDDVDDVDDPDPMHKKHSKMEGNGKGK